ncbi:MAG: hypothetical protein ABIJ96_10260 [Elusimicrobiota bacterium]
MRLLVALFVLFAPAARGEVLLVPGAADKARWDREFDGAAPRKGPAVPVMPDLTPDIRPKKTANLPLIPAGLLAAARENAASSVWPGYEPLAQPIQIFDGAGGAFLINHPAPPAGYRPLRQGGITVHHATDVTPPFNGPFLFHTPLGGEDTFAIKSEAGWKADRTVATVVHERFHVFQETAFTMKHFPSRYPKADGTDVALANLANAALAAAVDALRTPDARRYARMFIAVRNARRQANPQGCADVEDGQERLEGMAHYAELKLTGGPGKVMRGTDKLIGRLKNPVEFGQMSKWRYYSTGAGQGYLLDAAGTAGWKSAVAAGQAVFSQMRAAYPVAPADEAALVAAAKAEFDFPALLARSNAELSGELRAIAEALEAFETSPLTHVRISAPKGVDGSFSFSKNFVLNDGSWLMPAVNSFEAAGPGYLLRLTKIDMINRSDGDEDFLLPADAVIRIDGAPARPADGETFFESLEITGTGLVLKAELPGRLIKNAAGLKIDFPGRPQS